MLPIYLPLQYWNYRKSAFFKGGPEFLFVYCLMGGLLGYNTESLTVDNRMVVSSSISKTTFEDIEK
jgi:hypothetical protein